MFQTITTNNKSVSGKLLSVKLTQTMSEINDAWVDFNESNLDMLEKVNHLDRMMSDMSTLERLTAHIEKSKLQPSMCKFLAGVEGLSDIAGVDFDKVTDKNRNRMSKEAFDGLKKTAKNTWNKIVEFFKAIAKAIKNFFVRLFSLTSRQINAVNKLSDGILKKIKEVDVDTFKDVEMKTWSKQTLENVLGALNKDIIGSLEKVAQNLDSESASKAISTKASAWRVLGYTFNDEKFIFNAEILKKKSLKLGSAGWTPEEVAKVRNGVVTTLKNVTVAKTVQASADTALNNLIKEANKLAQFGKSEDKMTSEVVMRGKDNVKILTKAISIYGSVSSNAVGIWISIASKMKVKKEDKKEDKKKK